MPIALDPRKRVQPIGTRNDPEHEWVSRMPSRLGSGPARPQTLGRTIPLPSQLIRLIGVRHVDQPAVVGNLGGRFCSFVQYEEQPSPFSVDGDDFSFCDLVEQTEPVLPSFGCCHALHLRITSKAGLGAPAPQAHSPLRPSPCWSHRSRSAPDRLPARGPRPDERRRESAKPVAPAGLLR